MICELKCFMLPLVLPLSIVVRINVLGLVTKNANSCNGSCTYSPTQKFHNLDPSQECESSTEMLA